jgi:hypothetical protein
MKLSEKKQSTFTPHPDSNGEYVKAVLVDITDLKKRITQYGEKDEFRLVFETEVMDTVNDRRFCIWSRGYTPSLNEKAALRKDLKRLMGRELTTLELSDAEKVPGGGFDTESLIGFGVKLIIQHETKDDRTYANISFMVPDKEKSLKPSGKYKRIKDREDKVDSADSEDEADEPAASGWEAVVVHVGKHKGKKLADVDEAGVKILIEKWLPTAKAAKNLEDAGLVAALDELSELLAGDDIPY